jgi:hypothetical protein
MRGLIRRLVVGVSSAAFRPRWTSGLLSSISHHWPVIAPRLADSQDKLGHQGRDYLPRQDTPWMEGVELPFGVTAPNRLADI